MQGDQNLTASAYWKQV